MGLALGSLSLAAWAGVRRRSFFSIAPELSAERLGVGNVVGFGYACRMHLPAYCGSTGERVCLGRIKGEIQDRRAPRWLGLGPSRCSID
jgi:hypothetical protein